jgi:hypothetical protein
MEGIRARSVRATGNAPARGHFVGPKIAEKR